MNNIDDSRLMLSSEVHKLLTNGSALIDDKIVTAEGRKLAEKVADTCQEYFGCKTGNRAYSMCHYGCRVMESITCESTYGVFRKA